MLRFILLLLLAYFIYKLIRIIMKMLSHREDPYVKSSKSKRSFDHIEEADYEDITHKEDEEEKNNGKKLNN